MKWYWPNAIWRSIRAAKVKSLLVDPVKFVETDDTQSREEENESGEETTSSYAMALANQAQSSKQSADVVNIKTVYQQRLDDFIGVKESSDDSVKRTSDLSERDSDEVGEDEDNEPVMIRREKEAHVDEELSDKEAQGEPQEDEEQEEDDVEVRSTSS